MNNFLLQEENSMILEESNLETRANLKAIGIGGCGGNAIQHMINHNINGVEFITANTDAQDLGKSSANIKVPLGQKLTNGRGAGANPDVGRDACLENRDQIKDVLQGTEMLFLTAGMGGGTGTGASPVIAEIAKELKILTVAVVTTPFSFEGPTRMKSALNGIKELSQYVDSIIVVPNEKLETELSDDIKLDDAYEESDSVLKGAVQGISDIINNVGRINLDFEDVRTVMSASGQAMMGTGESSGANRAVEAANLAVNSPLLNDINLKNAKAILINVSANSSITLKEYADACKVVKTMAAEDATIIDGEVTDQSLGDKIKVTVIATGLNAYKPITDPNTKMEEVNNSTTHTANVSGTCNVSDKKPGTEEVDEGLPETTGVEATDEVKPGIDYLDIPTFLRKQKN